ncbi:MAG: hypothetical protein ACRCXD_14430, partial [Luteolibacter sp.]
IVSRLHPGGSDARARGFIRMERSLGKVLETEKTPSSDHDDPTGNDEGHSRQMAKYDERNDWPAMLI